MKILFILILNFRSSLQFNTNGAFVNVASVDAGATCLSVSPGVKTINGFTYSCTHALKPIWRDPNPLLFNCSSMCHTSFFDISFKTSYDLQLICFRQGYGNTYIGQSKAIKKVDVQCNGQTRQLDLEDDYEYRCHLINFVHCNKIRIYVKELTIVGSVNDIGFNEVGVWAHNPEITSFPAEEYGRNYLDSCLSIIPSPKCNNIIKYGPTDDDVNCPLPSCPVDGLEFNVTLTEAIRPDQICAKNVVDRQYNFWLITWSSGYTQSINLDSSPHNVKCLNYNGSDIERWVKFTPEAVSGVEIPQIWTIDWIAVIKSERNSLSIKAREDEYKLYKARPANWNITKFSLRSHSNCNGFYIILYEKLAPIMTLTMEKLTAPRYILSVNGDEETSENSYLSCNKWVNFYIDWSDEVRFGILSDDLENETEILSIDKDGPFLPESLAIKTINKLNIFEIRFLDWFEAADLDKDFTVEANSPSSCLMKKHFENLIDRNMASCISFNNWVKMTVKHNNLPSDRETVKVKITVKDLPDACDIDRQNQNNIVVLVRTSSNFLSICKLNSQTGADGAFKNFASLENNAICNTSKAEFEEFNFTYECKNSLSPIWQQPSSFVIKCGLEESCTFVNITVTFARKYDIQQICFRQGFTRNSNTTSFIEKIRVTFKEEDTPKNLFLNLQKDYDYRCHVVHLKDQSSLVFSPERYYEPDPFEFALGEIGVWGYTSENGEKMSQVYGSNLITKCTDISTEDKKDCNQIQNYSFDYWLSSKLSNFKFCIINPITAMGNIQIKVAKILWSNGDKQLLQIERNSDYKINCFDKELENIEWFKLTVKEVWSEDQDKVGIVFIGMFNNGHLLEINNETAVLNTYNGLSNSGSLSPKYLEWEKFFVKWNSESIQFGRLFDKQETLLSINSTGNKLDPNKVRFGSESTTLAHEIQIFNWFSELAYMYDKDETTCTKFDKSNYFLIKLKPKNFNKKFLQVIVTFNDSTSERNLLDDSNNYLTIYLTDITNPKLKMICSGTWTSESAEATKCKYICECQNDLCNDVYIVLFGSGNGQPEEICEITLI
ncbi:DgyrCDS13917 [Dimorphilus gyrociliatus]|uniref:DgyrCDS13917 n=1 Tax=Dimorphilus gyrociliatus TaxID=2664684 RepID=A0A7I8WCC4_9ANNE|nr:DgyrCDS13917 [Dimorphilus gyrociliatus]